MTGVLVCPFCRHREPEWADDGVRAFQGQGEEEVAECPCGAVAFRSPSLQARVQRSEPQAVDLVRACVGAGAGVPTEMRSNALEGARPPVRLLWVRKGGDVGPAPPGQTVVAPAAPAKVLCIDDDRVVCHLLTLTLPKYGFVPLTAPDGPTGIALAQAERPQLILVDLLMPGMDGFEVCRRLRTDPQTRPIPLIILTARADAKLHSQAFQAGADLALTKPFQAEKLMATLRAALALKQGRARS